MLKMNASTYFKSNGIQFSTAEQDELVYITNFTKLKHDVLAENQKRCDEQE